MYSTEVDGRVFEFGTSGWLFQSNKLMYDRGTNTLWHQFRGEPVVGELAGSGITLEILPMALTTWFDWVAAHPDTLVLDNQTGVYPADFYRAESRSESAYFQYRQEPGTMFSVPQKSEELPTKSRVLGLSINGRSRAYSQAALELEPVLNDSLGGDGLVVVTPDGGTGSRAFRREGRIVDAAGGDYGEPGAVFLLDDQGHRWRMQEDALVRVDDPTLRLPRIPGRSSYWFGWYAFYPGTDVYSPGD